MTKDAHIDIPAPKQTPQEPIENKKNKAEDEMGKLDHGRSAAGKGIKKVIKTKKDL